MKKIFPWNKGLTKGMDIRVERASENMKGRKAWNKGLTKKIDKRLNYERPRSWKKGCIPWNKNGKGLQATWNKGMKGKGNSFYGKKHSEETKRKMSNKHEGNKNPMFGMSGNRNPNWQGGLSFEPYNSNFNNKFKRAIRKRDNQICMLCGIHREKIKKALGVHHINYNKELSIPQNCLYLCNTCHTKTNYNRKHWMKFFYSVLSEKYGYNYSSEKIILEVKNDN